MVFSSIKCFLALSSVPFIWVNETKLKSSIGLGKIRKNMVLNGRKSPFLLAFSPFLFNLQYKTVLIFVTRGYHDFLFFHLDLNTSWEWNIFRFYFYRFWVICLLLRESYLYLTSISGSSDSNILPRLVYSVENFSREFLNNFMAFFPPVFLWHAFFFFSSKIVTCTCILIAKQQT